MDTFRHTVIVKSPVPVSNIDEAIVAVETALDNLVAARNYLVNEGGGHNPYTDKIAVAIAALAGVDS